MIDAAFTAVKTILNSAERIKSKKIQIKVGDIGLFKRLINSLDMPERWKLRLIRHFWRPKYFEELLERLEKNSDIDSVTFDTDKKRFYEMKKMSQDKVVAGRSISEILNRFNKKIKDPRSFSDGKKIVITGGIGYIGTELCKIYSGYSWNDSITVFAKKPLQWFNHNMKSLSSSVKEKLIEKYKDKIRRISKKMV